MNTVMQTAVAEHKSSVQKAEADLKQARITEAKRQLDEVREAGRKCKHDLDAALKELDETEVRVLQAREALVKINAQLEATVEPDLLDFPTEREVAAIHVEQARLREQQRQAGLKLRDAQAAVPRLRCVELDQQLVNLRQKARNLQSIIDGQEGKWYQGSVSGVA